jgi:hypothetical protein
MSILFFKINLNTEIEGELWKTRHNKIGSPVENYKKHWFRAKSYGTPTPNSNNIPVFKYFMKLENGTELSSYQFGYNIRIWTNSSLMDH